MEWGKDALYINKHWTEELLILYFIKKRRNTERQLEKSGHKEKPAKPRRAPESQLFEQMAHWTGFKVDRIRVGRTGEA